MEIPQPRYNTAFGHLARLSVSNKITPMIDPWMGPYKIDQRPARRQQNLLSAQECKPCIS